MHVEIDNVLEVKEIVINQNGELPFKLQEYAGHIVKIMILNQKKQTISANNYIDRDYIEKGTDFNRIEGFRYRKGQKKSRQTAKDFTRFISRNLNVIDKTSSWITLDNNALIRYSNSVVYDGDEGDFLWYSLSFESLNSRFKKGDYTLAFIIRDSKKMVYINAKEIIDDLKKAYELRKNDWIHVNIIFSNNLIKFHIKTGKENKPIEKEFSRHKHYITWDEFLRTLKEK